MSVPFAPVAAHAAAVRVPSDASVTYALARPGTARAIVWSTTPLATSQPAASDRTTSRASQRMCIAKLKPQTNAELSGPGLSNPEDLAERRRGTRRVCAGAEVAVQR